MKAAQAKKIANEGVPETPSKKKASLSAVRGAKPLKEAKRAKSTAEERPERALSVSARAKLIAQKISAIKSIPVAVDVDPSMRPLCGHDVEAFRAKHRLLIPDMTYMLALLSGSQYNAVAINPCPLSYDAEFLVRICDAYPTPPPWEQISMHEAFNMLYGPALAKIEKANPEILDQARVILNYRFTALCGRSSFSGYRWIESEGAAKRSLYRVMAKIFERQDPLQTAEQMARLIWGVRGIDFDASFPMPSVDNIRTHRGPGRLPGSASRKAALRAVDSSSKGGGQ